MTSFTEALALFLKKHPVSPLLPLEEDLQSLKLEEALSALGLPAFLCPKILRKLPRLFYHMNPDHSCLKPAFTDLKILKAHWIDKTVLYLYSLLEKKEKGSVLLLTWVFPDGRGDLFASHHAKHFLEKTFPHFSIDQMLFLHHKSEDKRISDLQYTAFSKEHPIHEAFSREQRACLTHTDLILELPTAFPYIEALKKALPLPPVERLGEHSLIESLPFQPSVSRCMGLHFLEKGIFRKELPSNPKLEDLENTRLRTLLLEPKDLRRLNFGYTKTLRGTTLYLMTLFHLTQSELVDLDICTFQLPYLVEALQKMHLESPLFQGVHKILLYTDKTVTVLPLHPQGKTIRLIHCTHLCQKDVLILTALTQDLLGCTGDQSVLEAIATGMPFLYDPPSFKRLFLKDLLEIAKHYLPSFPALHTFFRLCLRNPSHPLPLPDSGFVDEDYLEEVAARESLEEESDEAVAQRLSFLLKEKELQEGFYALRDCLNKHYALEPLLKGLILRALCHQRHPEIKQKEKELLSAFTSGSIATSPLLEQLIQLLFH